jgi:hypothetical protein
MARGRPVARPRALPEPAPLARKFGREYWGEVPFAPFSSCAGLARSGPMGLPWIHAAEKPFRPYDTVREGEKWLAELIPADSPDRERRLKWANQLAQMMSRVCDVRHGQARSRNSALRMARLAAGGTAAFTTLTGSTLLAHLRGAAATTIGIIAVVLGISGAALAALRPQEGYAMDVVMAAKYENLWWDMYVFGSTRLPDVSWQDFADALSGFAEREAAITSMAGKPDTE